MAAHTHLLTGRRILLVIGGGISAYKSLDLIRRLRERGVSVRAVVTAAAAHFVTPLSVASLTGEDVHEDLFSLTREATMGHIELSRDADLLVVAPATAGLMAKMAQGLADDLASTLLLATDKTVLIAPAMNLRMWLHPATVRNRALLESDGVRIVGPEDGAMACGEYGPGRMAEPLDIVEAIGKALAAGTQKPLPPGLATPAPTFEGLRGRRVLVTSGPTHEPIDPVRYLANRSSGRQGHAIAAAAAAAGAEVVLVSGPVEIADPPGVAVIHVERASDMLAAVDGALPADVFVAAAAVADWRVADLAPEKLKKRGAEEQILRLRENSDILASVGRRREARPTLVVGFAAETERLIDNARRKLESKGCDIVVANDVGPASGIMGGEANEVHIVTREGVDAWPRLPKAEVATRLVALIAARLESRS